MPTIKDISIHQPSDAQVKTCQSWPIWTCGISEFEWEYTQTEKCLILEGRVTVFDNPKTDQSVTFGAGDFVRLPEGLKCIWKITEPVRKHYDFE